ncbi:MAG TPA: A24 family peptidase [Terracidiphilus sp.]|nr:A24 family peptidase [Terracidiphilus sp.]
MIYPLTVTGQKEQGMHSFVWWSNLTAVLYAHRWVSWPTLVVLGVATFTDLHSRRIPNWLVFPYWLAGIVVRGVLFGWHGVGQSLAGAGVAIGIFGVFFLLGGMGAGDVKLCAAVGAWIGPAQTVFALILTALAGGVIVLVWAALGGFLLDLFKGTGDLMAGWKHGTIRDPEATIDNPGRRKIPYAPAIAVGTLFSFFVR